MNTGRINRGSLSNFIRVSFHIYLRRTCHHQTRRPDKSPPLSLLHWLKTTFLAIVSRLLKCVLAPFICQCNASGDDPFKHIGHQLSSYIHLYMQYTRSIMHFKSADLESSNARSTYHLALGRPPGQEHIKVRARHTKDKSLMFYNLYHRSHS